MARTVVPKSKHNEFVMKNLLAGGVAGCCAKTTVAPFDRVKILLQAHHKHFHHMGIRLSIVTLVQREGFLALYKGNTAQMIRIFPYAAIQFTSYEHYKMWLRDKYPTHPKLSRLSAGSLAGLTAVLVTYPLDVIRARLAYQGAGEIFYTGILNAFFVMFSKEGGLKAFYKGIIPTLLGMVPYAGLSFCCFETFKCMLLENFPHLFGVPCPQNDGQLVLMIPAKALCGGVAGALAQTVAYPLDVARRKMQLSLLLPESHKFRTWYVTLVVVHREHGVRHGLYRGLSVNYIKVVPMVAVSFTIYEVMKQMLGLDTHVDR